jgi:uncharacterized protein YkwD
MKRNLLVIFLSLALMVSACNAQTPVVTIPPTSTATLVATSTQTPLPVQAASAIPIPATAIPISVTPISTNSPDCTNSAAFVADVNVPDNTIFPSNATFTKTWRVRNTGTCIWGPAYTLTYYSDEQMGPISPVPLSVTLPNQTADISVDLRVSSSIGTHKSFFVIKNPAGLIMKIDNDSRLWVVINVSSKVASVPTATQGSGNIPVTGSDSGSGFAKVTCAYTTDATRIADTINAINTYRTQNALPTYTVNELLTKAAAAHANDMACNNLFSHTGSDNSTPITRVAASGYAASSVTENVYGSYPPLTGQGAVDWWKSDKTDIRHNQNLLSTSYTEIGVGYAFYNNFGYYVIDFATPK